MPPEEDMAVLARLFGRHVFPDRRTVFKPVYVSVDTLPSSVKADSQMGLEMLGLIGTHLRICKVGGGSGLAKFLLRLHSDLRFTEVTGKQIGEVVVAASSASSKSVSSLRSASAELLLTQPTRSKEWSADRRVHAPPKLVLVTAAYKGDKAQLGEHPVGPFLTRHAFESWYDGTHEGIPGQFETKRGALPLQSIAWFLPNVVMHTASVHGEDFSRVLRRGSDWNAREARLAKPHLITMLNSNCGDAVISKDIFFKLWGRYTFVRELLTFAFYKITGKPVHNLGRCPRGDEGATRAGLTQEKREKLQDELVRSLRKGINRHFVTNREVYAAHKFSIVFENSPMDGYATEKVVK